MEMKSVSSRHGVDRFTHVVRLDEIGMIDLEHLLSSDCKNQSTNQGNVVNMLSSYWSRIQLW